MSTLHRLCLCVIAAVAIAAPLSSLAAESRTEPGKATDSPTPETAKAERALLEQDIYIPYDKLRGVFEKHGRGVFLPYEKFDELWKAAREKTRPAAEPRPPVGAIITEIENEAVVSKDVVRVTAKIKIDLLTEGWHEVPLRLADAAIVRATIKNEPARILGNLNEDHRLLIEKKGKQPEQIELTLEYARAIARSPGQNSVSFQAPQAAVSRWKVRIPQSGVKVNLHPLIAATEVPPAASAPSGTTGGGGADKDAVKKDPGAAAPEGETVVLAFVGAAPTVQIDWTPKSEGATGLSALASVQADQVIFVQEGITRVRTNLVYTISRAELKQVSMEVPAEYKVVNVFDANVRQWSVEAPTAGASVQTITAQLFEPAKAAQTLVVELEKIAGQKRQESLKAPVVKALNVARQQGCIVAQVSQGLRAEAAKTSGLLQVDANELPPAFRGNPWAFAYRYSSVPFELELTLEEVQPRISVEALVEARLTPEKLHVELLALYNIERAGVFRLELDAPEGFEFRSAAGAAATLAAAPYAAAEVESFHLEGEKKTRLVVNLARKAMGRVGLKVQFQRDLQDSNLLTPTGKASEIDLPLPRVTKTAVEHSAGRLVIRAPESLRINPAKADGLRPVSAQEALEGIGGAPSGAGVRPVLAFTFTQEPTALRLAAERRKPQVTVRQLLVARIEEGVVKYQATFHYSIQYSGVKSLRIDVPADVAPLLRNTTPGVREKAIDPPPADLDKDMVAWSLAGEGELLGNRQIDLVWEKKLEKLEVGKTAELLVPRLIPRGADLAWGQIVIAKAETLDFQESEELKGLRPIDPQRDISPPVGGAARAFEFHEDWTLPVAVTRYELEEVKRTSIDRGVVRMVITPKGEIAAQAVYRVRSVRPILSVKLPENATLESEPVRINGQSITPQKGQNDSLGIPLLNTNSEEPFVLELRYALDARQGLVLPAFPEDTAQQKVYLCAFVPSSQDVVGTAGTWSEDFRWTWDDNGRLTPQSPQSHERRMEWVCEGNPAALGAARNVHLDGTPLIFSTLRPDGQSTVRLWAIDHTVLNVAVFAVVVLAGLLLLRARWITRAVAIAAFLAILATLGVVWPTLAMHALSPALLFAAVVVAIAWIIMFLIALVRNLESIASAVGATWSAWVASKRAMAAPQSPAAGSTKEGGASHE